MYKNKYKYKKMKKKLFLFNVKTSGDYFNYDWCETNTNEFPIIISHIDKNLAKRSLYTTYNNWTLYDWLIKDFWKRTINQINSVIIKDEILNKENIKKAIEYKNKIYKNKYFHYGEIFLNLNLK